MAVRAAHSRPPAPPPRVAQPAAPLPAEPPSTRLRDGTALLVLAAGVLLGILVALPAEGRVAGPLRTALGVLLGDAAVALPIYLVGAGALALLKSGFPALTVPTFRVVGAGLLAVVGLVALHALGQDPAASLERARAQRGGGLVGHWLSSTLLEWLGGPLTTLVLLAAGAVGALVLFDLTLAQVGGASLRAGRVGYRVAARGARLAGRGTVRTGRAVGRMSRSVHARVPRRMHAVPMPSPRASFPTWRPRQRARQAVPRAGSSRAEPDTGAQNAAPTLLDSPPPPRPVVEVRSAWGSADQDYPEHPAGAGANPPVADAPRLPPHAAGASTAAGAADTTITSRIPGMGLSPAGARAREERTLPPAPSAGSWLGDGEASRAAGESPAAIDPDVRDESAVPGGAAVSPLPRAAGLSPVPRGLDAPSATRDVLQAAPLPAPALERPTPQPSPRPTDRGLPTRAAWAVPSLPPLSATRPTPEVASPGLAVTVRDVVASPLWQRSTAALRLALGHDAMGDPLVADLARMPHLLVAGGAGSDAMAGLEALVAGLLAGLDPDELGLVLLALADSRLAVLSQLPHLRLPLAHSPRQALGALRWAGQEVERRMAAFATRGVRDMDAFNRLARSGSRHAPVPLPHLVVVVAELADVMLDGGEDAERAVSRLAQLGRPAGVHLLVATRQPSVEVLSGPIRAHLPARLAFAVESQSESRIVLDAVGAERLGGGEALFQAADATRPTRLRAALATPDDLAAVAHYWTAQGPPGYTAADPEALEALARGDADDDALYEQAAAIAEGGSRVSASLLQRRLGIGAPLAQRLLERLRADGLVEG